MNDLFDNIFVSCPNEGGVFFLNKNTALNIDCQSTTGLFFDGNTILRAVQPNDIHLYSEDPRIIYGEKSGFGDVHDAILHDNAIYIVGTDDNEVVKLKLDGSELQRWKFPGDKDSWHINCLGVWNNRVVFSAFGNFREHRQYKGRTKQSGFVQDLLTGNVLVDSLSQPHSVTSRGSSLFIANSEEKELIQFNKQGKPINRIHLNGYTRGISIRDNIAYVGLSKSRNIDINQIDNSAVVAVDLKTFEELDRIIIPSDEIYSIVCCRDETDSVRFLSNFCRGTSTINNQKQITSSERFSSLESEQRSWSAERTTLNEILSERASEIAGLLQAAIHKDDEISGLQLELQACKEQVNGLSQITSDRDDKLNAIQTELLQRDEQIAVINQITSDQNNELNSVKGALLECNNKLERVVAESEERVANLTLREIDKQREIDLLNNNIEGYKSQIIDLGRKIDDLSKELDYYYESLTKIQKSLFWKITKPVRYVFELFPLRRKKKPHNLDAEPWRGDL